MGNLGDALAKAGLVDKKADRQRAPEDRAARGTEPERRASEQTPAPPAAAEPPSAPPPPTDWNAARDIIRRAALEIGSQGKRRFHYEAPDGSLPYFLVDDRIGRALEVGELAIVTDGVKARIVPQLAAVDLERVATESLLFFVRSRR